MRDYATKDKLLYGPSGRQERKRPESRRAKASSPKSRRGSSPAWLWMCIGLALGIICIILAWVWGSDSLHRQWAKLKHSEKASTAQVQKPIKSVATTLPVKTVAAPASTTTPKSKPATAHSKTETHVTEKAKVPKQTEPQFDFYTMLPKQKVGVKVPDPAKSVASSQRQFMLQVASYQDQPSAQAMLKRLQKLGLKAKVDRVGSGKTTWYRVDLGPYTSVRSADVVRHTLQNSGVNGAMIRQLLVK